VDFHLAFQSSSETRLDQTWIKIQPVYLLQDHKVCRVVMVERSTTPFALFLLVRSNPHRVHFFTHQEVVSERGE